MTEQRASTPDGREHRPGFLPYLCRLLVPVLLFGAGLWLLLRFGSRGGDPSAVPTLVERIAFGGLMVVLVGVTLLWLARRGRGRSYTGALVPRGRAFLVGFGVWAVPALITFGVLTLLGARWSLPDGPGRAALVITLLLIAVLLSEAVPEELIFRGHVTDVLGERLGGWPVILVQAALFTGFAWVLRGSIGVLDLSMLAGMGIAFGYFRMVTGTVWLGIGFHTAFQTCSQLLLTHQVVGYDGSATAAMVALGPVPFAVGATVVTVLADRRPQLFRRRESVTDPAVRASRSGGAPGRSG